MIAAALVTLLILVVGVPTVVMNRDLLFGRSHKARAHSAPFLIFPLEKVAAHAAELPVPAWPARQAPNARGLHTDIAADTLAERMIAVTPEPGLADVRNPSTQDDGFGEVAAPARGSWVESSPADFHWPPAPVSPELAD